MPFMRVGTYPTGNYATLGPSQLQPPFTGDSILRLTRSLFTYRHRAGLRPNTSFFKFAKSCVFSKQSPPSIHIISEYLNHQIEQYATIPFIPKLQSHFAQFLQYTYLNAPQYSQTNLPVSVLGTVYYLENISLTPVPPPTNPPTLIQLL